MGVDLQDPDRPVFAKTGKERNGGGIIAAVGVLLATLSPVTAVEKLRASDKAALAECLKYVGDFPGEVPGVNDTPTPALHIDNTIKLAGQLRARRNSPAGADPR
ncbi:MULTISPECIES: hypothetical protein [unclassified Mesorhizobium]|uniref:hypothetical protein n=1 Tax=unclassified Mesorhizobium TaxID=325217 RepID=UPI000F7519BC|nr:MULTISPECIES: hypothetical protein [unclassified Mesorhizobium]AZO07111.1 hypothetical protein EJ068_31655 [Mesorhizobium sp. M2A.F.Ca.ET.043.02.1.1]RUW30028.1 hypothetical protein EOA37_34015 [Mesorhizobium sp. M2A.F.Ca.ET.015.02.1.1]RUW66789.1 hypothetical protein EOA28_30260 [Mesorhizobium sp. M2A.F.Ca.ET.067.02.1.1]RVC96163.1 hypothetical protein EN739_09965 [Mesorhizobium sp. M2A.F.Ca.ET.017.03.2.1]RVD03006.1 hypothetical protein EN753_21965 [Mesorhizobium sp. M2A.F.Ca.ET.029.05.1.1]